MTRNAKTNQFYVERQGESAKFFTDTTERDTERRKVLTIKPVKSRLSLSTQEKTAESARQAAIARNQDGVFLPNTVKKHAPTGKYKPARNVNAKSAVTAYIYQKGQNAFPLSLDSLIANGSLITEKRFKSMIAAINETGGIEFYSIGNAKGFSSESMELTQRVESEKAELKNLLIQLKKTIELIDSPEMQGDGVIIEAARESVAMFHGERLPAQREKIRSAQAALAALPDINITVCRQIIGKRHALVQCFDALHRAKLRKESRVTEQNLRDKGLRKLCNQLIVNHGLGQYLSDSYESDARESELRSKAVEKARKLKRKITGQGIDLKTGRSVKVFNGVKHDALVTDSPDLTGRIDWKTGKQLSCPDIRYQEHLDSLEHNPLPKLWRADSKLPDDNGKSRGRTIVRKAGTHRKRFAPT